MSTTTFSSLAARGADVLQKVKMANLAKMDVRQAIVLGIATIFVYAIGQMIYNLFLHPLARFPGPLWMRATRLGYVVRMNQGKIAYDLRDLHNKYGSIVRIAPNELAFQEPQAWKDIYGHRTGNNYGAQEMDKAHVFYRTRGEPLTITSGDRNYHGILRRQLSHGFGDKAMREQEPIIGGYVDLLIQRLHENCTDPEKEDVASGKKVAKSVEMVSWYNWTTFDIIGDLVFGEPFGSLHKGEWDPWVASINGLIRFLGIINGVKHMGLEAPLMWLVWLCNINRRDHDDRMMEKMKRRVAMGNERGDIIQGLLEKKEDFGLSMEHLQWNSSSVLIAGSETTATMLSGVTYMLLSNPRALRKVTREVRMAFKSSEDITLLSVGSLTYMLACLNESLRVYPPVPFGMPRQVPKGGGQILGEYIPENTIVAVWHWAAYHSERMWKDPFEYVPERFLGDEKYKNDAFGIHNPFSHGPRNCIGRHLAYAEMRLILARILFDFDIELVDPHVKWLDQNSYVLWSKPKLDVYLRPRDKSDLATIPEIDEPMLPGGEFVETWRP